MDVIGDGRNAIPRPNSDGKCLIENWVEERAVLEKHLDPEIKIGDKITSQMQIIKNGHRGVLTTDFDAPCSEETTVRVTYTPPKFNKTRTVGSKRELMEKVYTAKVCEEMKMHKDGEPEPTDFRTVKMVDYDFEFQPLPFPSTRDHNYRREQPVTFWTEHKDKMHGVTQVKTRDTAFRRNDAFSKPLGEYWDQTLPYQLENYPKM